MFINLLLVSGVILLENGSIGFFGISTSSIEKLMLKA